jgi:hypothetical protein
VLGVVSVKKVVDQVGRKRGEEDEKECRDQERKNRRETAVPGKRGRAPAAPLESQRDHCFGFRRHHVDAGKRVPRPAGRDTAPVTALGQEPCVLRLAAMLAPKEKRGSSV